MKPNRRILFTLLLAAVSGLTACERSDGLGDLTGPSHQPQFSNVNSNGRGLGNGHWDVEFVQRANALTGDVTYTTVAPLGPQGGTLSFGGHTLVVPRNAVKHWTHFSATLRAGAEVRIDLRAWDMFGDVTTFRRPVELTINLADADIADISEVSVFYLDPNGSVERMPTSVDVENRSVTAFLVHFSDYIPGTLRSNPPQAEL